MGGQPPAWLGTLNAVIGAESCGREAFAAWAGLTPDVELREVLEVIAGKEREHAFSFARQVRRLGFEPQPLEIPGMQDFRELLGSQEKSDVEKLAFFCPADRDEPFAIAELPNNPDYDDDTRALMTRFVAEERDTFRLLREELERLDERPRRR